MVSGLFLNRKLTEVSWFWISIASLSFVAAALFVVLGFGVPRLLPFTENLIAEAFGIAIGLGLAVIVIEGRALTQQTRRRKILTRTAKSIVAEASEIGMMLTWEIGTWLVSALDSTIDLYGEDRGDDWDADIKPLLREVYDQAEALTTDIILAKDILTYEDYRSWIDGIERYSNRIRRRFEANLDIHEHLLELAEAFDSLDSIMTRTMWSSSVGTEVDRICSLGRVGNALTLLMEVIGTTHARL